MKIEIAKKFGSDRRLSSSKPVRNPSGRNSQNVSSRDDGKTVAELTDLQSAQKLRLATNIRNGNGDLQRDDKMQLKPLPKLNPKLSPSEARENIQLLTKLELKEWRKKIVLASEIRDSMKAEFDKQNKVHSIYGGKSHQELYAEAKLLLETQATKGTLDAAEKEKLEELELAILLRNRSSSEFITTHFKPASTSTTYEKFLRVANRHVSKLEISKKEVNDELYALIACLCVKPPKEPSKNPNGIFDSLPGAIFPDENDPKLATVGKYYFIEIEGMANVREIEKFKGWNNRLREMGFRALIDLSMPTVLKAAWPNWLDGLNPIFREWVLHINKWNKGESSGELAERASAHYLLYEAKLVNGKSFNVGKFRSEKSWQQRLVQVDLGLNSMLDTCPYTPNLLAPFVLGGKRLKEEGIVDKELVGLDDDQIPWWEITHEGIWDDRYGKNMFRLNFAKELANAGLGNFNTSIANPIFTFTKKELITWHEDKLEANKKTLSHFLNEKLPSAYKHLPGSAKRALEILLNQKIKPFYSSKEMIMNLKQDEFTLTFEPVDIYGNVVAQKKLQERKERALLVREKAEVSAEARLRNISQPIEASDDLAKLRQKLTARIVTISDIKNTLIRVIKYPFLESGVAFVKKPKAVNGQPSSNSAVSTFGKPDRFSTQGTRLGRLLDKPESLSLYKVVDALACDSDLEIKSSCSVLEKILIAKHPTVLSGGGYVLQENTLRELLQILKNHISEFNLNSGSRFKTEFESLIDNLLAMNTDPREVILQAILESKIDQENIDLKKRASLVQVLDQMIGYLAAVLVQKVLEGKITGQRIPDMSPFLTREKIVSTNTNASKIKTAKIIASKITKRWLEDRPIFEKHSSKAPELLEQLADDRQKFSGVIQGIVELTNSLRRIAIQLRGEDKGVLAGSLTTTYDRLTESVYDVAVVSEIDDAKNDSEINTLVAYFCMQRKLPKDAKEPQGFLTVLPEGLFEPSSNDFVQKLRAAWKFFAIN